MSKYGEMQTFDPGNTPTYAKLVHEHQATGGTAAQQNLYMIADDPNDKDAVAYAGAFNTNLQLTLAGDSRTTALPLPKFRPDTVHLEWRDRQGNVRPDPGIARLNNQVHQQLTGQEKEIGDTVLNMFAGMGQAMQKAEKNAPSDHIVSFIPKEYQQVVFSDKNGSVVVDRRNAKAVAFGQEIPSMIKDGKFDESRLRAGDTPPLGTYEFRPPSGASAAEIKDANEMTIMMHEMGGVFDNLRAGKSYIDPASTAGVKPVGGHAQPTSLMKPF